MTVKGICNPCASKLTRLIDAHALKLYVLAGLRVARGGLQTTSLFLSGTAGSSLNLWGLRTHSRRLPLPPSHLSAGRGPRPALTELPVGDTSCEEAARRPRLPHRSLPPAVVPSSWRRGAPRGPFFPGLVPRCRARPERRTAVPACAQPAPEHRGQQEEEKAEEEETSRWAWSRGQCSRSGFGLEELTVQR